MAKYEQAPLLKHSGKKEQYINSKNGTFYKYSPDLFAAIMNCLDSRDTVSIKIMLFLAGNGGDANFRIASKTICERCNVSERRYVSSRQKLVDMGWLRHKEGDYIEVCFDTIYNDYRKLLSQRDDITSCQRDDITSYEKISYTDITSCQRDDVKTLDGMTLRHEMGCHYVMDNKINNNINNNIKIEKGVPYASLRSAPPAASGGEFFQKMKELVSKLESTDKKSTRNNMIDDFYYDEVVGNVEVMGNPQLKEDLTAKLKELLDIYC